MLRGLKAYTRDITAIVTVADDGGGSGMLREDLGMLPPGRYPQLYYGRLPIRSLPCSSCSITALPMGALRPELRQPVSGGHERHFRLLRRSGPPHGGRFGHYGPCSPCDQSGRASGSGISRRQPHSWRKQDFLREKDQQFPVSARWRLVPERPAALPESVRAIREADIVVIGPGSLYTSIIPNFLVSGIADAVRRAGP